MDHNHYMDDPNLRDYYAKLPGHIQSRLLRANLEISTLGELMLWAEHFKMDEPKDRKP
ncbi:hypothetical protein [Gehongia tenuis]|uniref:Uncharacterized protein n=1 Tax=Gehongia tenuis TaxID=2763655 RepID=A0A926D3H2_9FIRM|nr:hypothetical protein [Gehongia tenuis]MBC8530667.1 hypothetical protein [Gehongia tenuis]